MVLGFATVSTAEAAPYKVGFALQTLEVAVWQRMVNGMEAAAADLGVEFQCMVANSDVSKQIANIENMISMGYDAIIVHVFDTQAFADVVQSALDAGIIICAYDDTIVDASTGEALDYQFSFVCDNYEIGYRVGTMAAEWTLATFDDSYETLQFGCLWHPEYKLQWDRVDGIKAALAELDPRVEIVEELEGLLVEDGVQDAIDMVAAGQIIRGDVGLDVYNGGYQTVEACVAWLNGETTEDVIMPMINVTEDSASEWINDPTLYG